MTKTPPMTDETPLPCPFCGNTKIEIVSNRMGDYYAMCGDSDDCGCEARTSDRRCENEWQAIERWNRRAVPAPPPKELLRFIEQKAKWCDDMDSGSDDAKMYRLVLRYLSAPPVPTNVTKVVHVYGHASCTVVNCAVCAIDGAAFSEAPTPVPTPEVSEMREALSALYGSIRRRGHAMGCVTFAPENATNTRYCDCGYHDAMKAETKIAEYVTAQLAASGPVAPPAPKQAGLDSNASVR